MEPIRSPHNRAVVEAGRLHRAHDRRRVGRTLIEGPHLVDEALAAGVRFYRTFHLDEDPPDPRWPEPTPVVAPVLAKLAGTEHPRGPVAVIGIPASTGLPTDRSVLVLWQVGDPGNVGTIIRSAGAFGLGIALGPDTADPWGPKVLRAGAGAHFRTPMADIAEVEDLAGLRVVATVMAGGIPPAELAPAPWAVLIGSEAHGLPAALVERAEQRISIPMPGGTESLNAAVAASIIAYELRIGSERHRGRH